MALIDRESTFRGKVVDHGISATKNEWPQFVCKLLATEIWDEEDQVWVSLADVELDANEITAYIVLIGKDGETLSFDQVKKVFKWDGASFQVLNGGDYSEVGIQFRVEENTYEEKTRLQVTWIDEYDAIPGRSVRKLDASELKQLDAKFAAQLKAGGKKTAPAKPKTAASGKDHGTVTAKGSKPTSPKGPVKKTTTAPKMPSIPEAPVGSCTKDEAWTEVVDMKDKKIADDVFSKCWVNAVNEVRGDRKVEDLTNEDWFQVKEKVLKETAVF